MTITQSYDLWAHQYDSNENKTRDLEGIALREVVGPLTFKSCLEIGCGTGKNTVWLAQRCERLTAVDISPNMLERAREKVSSSTVTFQQADITGPWSFTEDKFDLVTFSLVLEHIEHLGPVFMEAGKKLTSGGIIYMGELHPFKQYLGSKARFDTDAGRHILSCFNHHISDFVHAAKEAGCELKGMEEYFDGEDRQGIPRILTMLARKM